MRYIGIIILLVLCLTLLFFTCCTINTVKPETASGNLENQEEINQSSNNFQSSSIGPVYETAIEDTEEPVIVDTGESVTVYPQQWATGDGTAENPWANDCIQKAYDFVPAGGTIFLKAGYYILSAQISFAKQVNIIGEGMGKTIIITADDYGFNINSDYGTVDYVTLKGFTMDGAAQTDGEFNLLINFDDCDYALLEDIEVKNSGLTAINLYECNYSSLQNIYAHDNYEHGVHANFDAVGRNIYNTYRDIYAWDNGENGFDDWGCEADRELQRNNVYDNIQAWGNKLIGIVLAWTNGGSLINSSGHDNGIYGIYLTKIYDFTIENCSAYSNYEEGICLYDSDNISLTNVIVKNNYSGIAITDCSNIALTSCQSYDDRETPLQQFGMELYSSTGISLLNCKLSPNQYGEIYNPAGVVFKVITE